MSINEATVAVDSNWDSIEIACNVLDSKPSPVIRHGMEVKVELIN